MQCGIRDENILAYAGAECAHVNQKMQDKFDIERQDAGLKKQEISPTK